jgi:hypothetical protein
MGLGCAGMARSRTREGFGDGAWHVEKGNVAGHTVAVVNEAGTVGTCQCGEI